MSEARDAAEAANRAKSVFLANMSHELRTPLNAILGFAQLLARDTRLPADRRGHLQIINRSGEHLLAIINDILEISRIEAGKVAVAHAPFALHELLDSLHDAVGLRARAKGLRLWLEKSADLPPCIVGDLAKLRQVLINLLTNAVKYTERGEVGVRALTRPATDDAVPDGLTLVFEVSDIGVGIEPEMLERIFEPFDQTDYGIRLGEGTGLGLAICQHYARLLGGRL